MRQYYIQNLKVVAVPHKTPCELHWQHYKLHRMFFAPLVIHIAKPPLQDASIQHNINMT